MKDRVENQPIDCLSAEFFLVNHTHLPISLNNIDNALKSFLTSLML